MKKNYMHLNFFILMFCILFLNICAWAVDYSTAIMIGTGSTKDEAIQDAIRKAVESATGVFVYSSSEVQNYVLVKDKIITASKGYVKDFKVLNESAKDSLIVVTLNVTVDAIGIKSVIQREIKAIAYEDALKDYAIISSLVERNKKYTEILKSISSKPLNELYQIDFVGYEIIDAGTASADVVLNVRIAQNRFLWDIYYDTLRQIGKNKSRYSNENQIVINYNYKATNIFPTFCDVMGEQLFLHKDFNNYVIKPQNVVIHLTLPDGKITLKPFLLYDKLMLDNTIKWGEVMPYTTRLVDSRGHFICDDGFEYKIRHTFKNIEDIKKLFTAKVSIEKEKSTWLFP